MSNTKPMSRLAEAIDWASLVVLAAAIVAYLITSSAVASLFFLVPAIVMRVVVLRLKRDASNLWLLIGTIAVTLLVVITSFNQ